MGRILLKDLKKTYWGRRIENARKRGYFNQEDADLAGNYQTCACGRKDPRLFLHGSKDCGPWDSTLDRCGFDFAQIVWFGGTDFQRAMECLRAIEERASVLMSIVRAAHALAKVAKQAGVDLDLVQGSVWDIVEGAA